MKWTSSRIVLGLALLATLAAVWFAPPAETEVVEASSRASRVDASPASTMRKSVTPPASQRAASVTVLRIRPRDGEALEQEWLFASTQWQPAPQKNKTTSIAAAEELPQAPQIPALPFRVLGRYEESGQAAVFLEHQNQNLVVRVGDTIDGLYKVEGLDQATLTLRYLPLDVQQTLELGAAP